MWELRDDDLSDAQTRALIAEHLEEMHGQTPPESVHALGVDALASADVRLFTAWREGVLGGMGAYRLLDEHNAELKSMRTARTARRQGLGRLILHHLTAAARAEGATTLWLETGAGEGFVAARRLYTAEGFAQCGPFGDYREDPESVFFRKDIGTLDAASASARAADAPGFVQGRPSRLVR